MEATPQQKPTLAIVGTGIAGLATAYFCRNHYQVTLFEQNNYTGGHTNTITLNPANAAPLPIDTGFMVMNPVTYPNLNRFFQRLGVHLTPTDMSFSMQYKPHNVEWSGTSLNHLFGQRRNLLKPSYWRFIQELQRFGEQAQGLLANSTPQEEAQPIADFVKQHGYSQGFVNWYLLPMGSSIWSTHPQQMMQFPIRTLLRFYHNHGFLGLSTHYQWYTVTGGSQSYVKALLQQTQLTVRHNQAVRLVAQHPEVNKIALTFNNAPLQAFDKVVLATHADEALSLLANPNPEQARLLSPFTYQRNTATLHSDATVMPERKRLWSAWNYRLQTTSQGTLAPATHYWMNRLQHLPGKVPYYVSINDAESINPDTIHWQKEYTHPIFTPAAIAAQKELPTLNQPHSNVLFAGSYFRYGFHEDAFLGALDASKALLSSYTHPQDPWQVFGS